MVNYNFFTKTAYNNQSGIIELEIETENMQTKKKKKIK